MNEALPHGKPVLEINSVRGPKAVIIIFYLFLLSNTRLVLDRWNFLGYLDITT